MKSMRSAVCKRANELVKRGYTKSNSFKIAWSEVKATANSGKTTSSVKAADLNTGDTIRIEYGVKGNFATCSVIEVSKTLYLGKYYIVTAKTANGCKVEFCSLPDAMIEKVA